MSKYKNIRTVVGDKVFDSKKEAARYSELLLLERAGLIHAIECQVRFPFIVNGVLICTYVCDFRYQTKDAKTVIEDVKSVVTKTAAYRIKFKLFHALYRDLRITEIF